MTILVFVEIAGDLKKPSCLACVLRQAGRFCFFLVSKLGVQYPFHEHLRTVTDFINFSHRQPLQSIPLDL